MALSLRLGIKGVPVPDPGQPRPRSPMAAECGRAWRSSGNGGGGKAWLPRYDWPPGGSAASGCRSRLEPVRPEAGVRPSLPLPRATWRWGLGRERWRNARKQQDGGGGGGEGVLCALEARSVRKAGVQGSWPASACPEPRGAVSCSPAASPRARVQDSLWANVAPFLPLCLAFPFLGERLDQGEVELEPRRVGVRE